MYGNGGCCCCCCSNLLAEYDDRNFVAAAAEAMDTFAAVAAAAVDNVVALVVVVVVAAAVDGQSSITICDSIGLLLGSGAIDLMGSERHGLRAARRRSTAESILRVFLKTESNIRYRLLIFN